MKITNQLVAMIDRHEMALLIVEAVLDIKRPQDMVAESCMMQMPEDISIGFYRAADAIGQYLQRQIDSTPGYSSELVRTQ